MGAADAFQKTLVEFHDELVGQLFNELVPFLFTDLGAGTHGAEKVFQMGIFLDEPGDLILYQIQEGKPVTLAGCGWGFSLE